MAIDFSNPKSVLDGIARLLDIPSPPATTLPPPLVLSTASRPGMSVIKTASRIIQRASEAGIPVGPMPSGEPNPAEQMEVIRIQEIFNALQTEANIQVALQPGVAVTVAGGNAGGPVVCQGATVSIGIGQAQIQ